MKVFIIALVLCLGTIDATSVGQNCGPDTYFKPTSFDVTPLPTKGKTSVITLKGTIQGMQFTLQDWDLYWNFEGQLAKQVDSPLSGHYIPNQNVTVTYNYAVPLMDQNGYYSLKLLLQTSQGYYINCWQFSYYLTG